MKPLPELIKKINWDERDSPEDHSFYYYERLLKKQPPFEMADIWRIEGRFIVAVKDGRETHIPTHRVREVRNKDAIVWKRAQQ